VHDSDLVATERVGCAAIITLNTPARRNLLTSASVAALVTAVENAEADPAVKALVITGAGRAFCSGADLELLEKASGGEFAPVRGVYEAFLRVMRSPLLTIAAVNGPAVGAGLNLALVCDVRLAAESAMFDARFMKLHIHPGGGHSWLMHRAVGDQAAAMAILFGEVWDAPTALSHGLVARVIADDGLLDCALAMTKRLAGHDSELIRRMVATLRHVNSGATHGEILEMEADAQRWSLAQPNARAALAGIRAALGHPVK
jgi:enoyl-CoA hydratase